MKPPMDVATRVSRELSIVLERLVGDADRDEPPTLDDVRRVARRHSSAAGRRDEVLHPQQSLSLLDEIESLIEEFGPEALAIDFVPAKASEALSRIIEVATGDRREFREPTLGGVRDAMVGGLTARLVGDGSIDPDEDQTLLDEIDGLIGLHGRDALAEDYVRFE